MKSIYSTFTGLFKDGKPIDFLATWKRHWIRLLNVK